MSAPARIALDAFGGDDCPGPEVVGALAAARRGVHVVLVGDVAKLEAALADSDWKDLPITLHASDGVIAMDDSPAKAVRAKPNASMPVCFDLVKSGAADAVMSAGNSGAMLACGLFKYRRIKGVDRPALVGSMPTRGGGLTTFLDIGANVECRALNLVQFAVLGAVYAAFKHGKVTPKVGLLSNGTEDSKGTELTRLAHGLLKAHPSDAFEYCGYAEGGDLYTGELDVVVTDGFTGNVALKVAEATGRTVGQWLKNAIGQSLRTKLGGLAMKPALAELRGALDPDSYGAAPLLGVRGMAFICHGAASSSAIARSLGLAARSVDKNLATLLGEAVEAHRPLFDATKSAEAERKASRALL